MGRYLIKRFIHALVVLFLVATTVFFIMRVVGDPATLMLDANATPAEYEQMKESLGLNDPLPVQYVHFLKDMATLDLGTSYRYKRPVVDMIAEALPYTLSLVGIAMLLAIPLADRKSVV